jgi:cytoplasmic iron level regulating protein YaaA (DUF328/UPF0246 family)
MFTILIHSSKTMRQASPKKVTYQQPALLDEATELATYLTSLTPQEIQSSMKLSQQKAVETHTLIQSWSSEPIDQLPAIDAFLGDIYSGLQVTSLSEKERSRANHSLYILSGLYGVLRALDGVHPYRLEMGYRLPDPQYKNLYTFWGEKIANQLPKDHTIINLSAVEYTKAVFPHLPSSQTIISPKFLTIDPTSSEPKFVVVHAKIARGAFAHWLIKSAIESESRLKEFSELHYRYSEELSTASEPVFICETFGGLGLSVRLTK